MRGLTIFNNSGPFTEIKLMPASLATAFARSVLPQPVRNNRSVRIKK